MREYVKDLSGVPPHLIERQRVQTRWERPRSTDPSDEGRPWYPELEEAFLLGLDDAYIGDEVVMDEAGYYGLDRWWLGHGDDAYPKTPEIQRHSQAVSIAGWGGEAFQLFVMGALPKLAMILELLDRPGFEELKIVSHRDEADAARWFWRVLDLEHRVVKIS